MLKTLKTDQEIDDYADLWRSWAHPFQLPPATEWRVWLFLGGRGAGKTRAGAEWVRACVEAGSRRVALIGPDQQAVREVMIAGPSGLLSIGPQEIRPRFEASRRRLVWPNGAVGYCFSGEDPDGLRGPQFDLAWADADRFRRHRLVRPARRLARGHGPSRCAGRLGLDPRPRLSRRQRGGRGGL